MRTGISTWLFLGTGVLLLAVSLGGYASADKGPCVFVDNEACKDQGREWCGVFNQVCLRCDGRPRWWCDDHTGVCFEALKICPEGEEGQCIPDPSNPGTLICGGWTAGGDGCPDPYPDCS